MKRTLQGQGEVAAMEEVLTKGVKRLGTKGTVGGTERRWERGKEQMVLEKNGDGGVVEAGRFVGAGKTGERDESVRLGVGGAMLNEKGIGVRGSKEVMVGVGFERTSHVASKRSNRGGCGADESLKGWASSGVRIDVGNVGWKESRWSVREGGKKAGDKKVVEGKEETEACRQVTKFDRTCQLCTRPSPAGRHRRIGQRQVVIGARRCG